MSIICLASKVEFFNRLLVVEGLNSSDIALNGLAESPVADAVVYAIADEIELTAIGLWQYAVDLKLEKNGYHVAEFLFNHSMQDNPSDIQLFEGHFITDTIRDSPEFQSMISNIVADHEGQIGTFDGSVGIIFQTGDLFLALNKATINYEITIADDGTWTIEATVHDYYDFAFETGYGYTYNGLNPGYSGTSYNYEGTAPYGYEGSPSGSYGSMTLLANNLAYFSQSWNIIENYNFDATIVIMGSY